MSRPLLVTLLLTLSVLCAACGSASTSAPFDGGMEDAGGPTADGGPDDAGTFVADAGAVDAGAVDAGVVAVDAGIEDAGAPLDGGQVDVTPPTVVFSERPEAVVAVDSARFAFAASEPATFACRLDAAAASPCVSPVSLTALAEGPHGFVVVATDAAGNASRQGAVAFAVDRTPPVTVLSAHPPLASADPMARFEFTSDDPNLLGFECSLEGAPFETCFSPYELEELTHGTHTLLVRALDLAGHVEAPAVRFAWRVDFEAPIVTVLSGPTGRVASREASLSFSTDDPDARAECKLDAQSFAPCTSPVGYTALSDGDHTFSVRAQDAVGNVSNTATRTWTIDAAGPTVTLTAGPAPYTQATQASFTFTSPTVDARFECALDRGAFMPCTSPQTYAGLSMRDYVFAVRAADALDHFGATATFVWTVVGPTTRLRLMAANITSGNNQNYDGGEGIRIFQGLRPDVVVLQEFNYRGNSAAELRTFVDTAFGARFSYFRETGAGLSIPNGVISRYPIAAAGSWVDSRSTTTRGFAWARIDLPGPKDLWAVSLHLLTSSAATRELEATELVAYIRAQVPAGDLLVLGGDLNTTLRTEPCITKLGEVVVVDGLPPVDPVGDSDTSGNRTRPYDWVLVNTMLSALESPLTLGAQSFPNGLVFDSRNYMPLSDVSPVLVTDSAATNMQHMAVVRDFVVAN